MFDRYKSRHKGGVLICVMAGFTLTLLYLSHGNRDFPLSIYDIYKTITHSYRTLNSIPPVPPGSKTILWYFPPRYVPEDLSGLTPLSTCSNLKCLITRNRAFLPVSDAVIFSAEHIRGDPPPRQPGQVWIFHNSEPPYLFAHNRPFLKEPWSSVFNWTMDFRHDADIVRPYAVLRNKTRVSGKNYTAVVEMKRGIVAIMVSNCLDWSGRMQYARELNKLIPVDIFGKCGEQFFPREKNNEWLQYLNSTYKFYLAFENLYCTDYITEKFFNSYNLDLVNVARGGGNYGRDVPPETYINVADFNSANDLAAYLWHLHENVEIYIEILKKKDMYYYETEEYQYIDPYGLPYTEHHYEKQPLCEVCRRLSNKPSHSKTIPDIGPWFKRGICIEAERMDTDSFNMELWIFVLVVSTVCIWFVLHSGRLHYT